jgi:multiple sugar transport system permease protein
MNGASYSNAAGPGDGFVERHFKAFTVGPAIFVLLLIGLFPFVYSLLVSFQNITMSEQDTSFAGFVHYARLFHDTRLWQAVLHTAIFTLIALPVELVLGLMMAQLFLDRMP